MNDDEFGESERIQSDLGVPSGKTDQWKKVLRRIVKEETEIWLPEENSPADEINFSTDESKFSLQPLKEPIAPIKEATEIVARYTPSSSPGSITYDTMKIATWADRQLEQAIRGADSGTRVILARSRNLFRRCFANAIRYHELFHYLSERFVRGLADVEDRYKVYKKEVYEMRDRKDGNLEEALADAYGTTVNEHQFPIDYYYRKTDISSLKQTRSPSKRFPKSDYFKLLTSIVSASLVSPSGRPRGYSKGYLYVQEMKTLLAPSSLLPGRGPTVLAVPPFSLISHFRGLTWFMDELLSGEQRRFDDYGLQPRRPQSFHIFLDFLENYRQYKPGSFFEAYLGWPEEKAA
ncbi:MAG: hypothetical protein QW292_04635 [Candidatus Parvarchaeota archaeon]